MAHFVLEHEYGSNMGFRESEHCFNLLAKCMGLQRCAREETNNFFRYDLYLSFSLCIWHLVFHRNLLLDADVNLCYSGTKTRGRTVNSIVVNYADWRVIQNAS